MSNINTLVTPVYGVVARLDELNKCIGTYQPGEMISVGDSEKYQEVLDLFTKVSMIYGGRQPAARLPPMVTTGDTLAAALITFRGAFSAFITGPFRAVMNALQGVAGSNDMSGGIQPALQAAQAPVLTQMPNVRASLLNLLENGNSSDMRKYAQAFELMNGMGALSSMGSLSMNNVTREYEDCFVDGLPGVLLQPPDALVATAPAAELMGSRELQVEPSVVTMRDDRKIDVAGRFQQLTVGNPRVDGQGMRDVLIEGTIDIALWNDLTNSMVPAQNIDFTITRRRTVDRAIIDTATVGGTLVPAASNPTIKAISFAIPGNQAAAPQTSRRLQFRMWLPPGTEVVMRVDGFNVSNNTISAARFHVRVIESECVIPYRSCLVLGPGTRRMNNAESLSEAGVGGIIYTKGMLDIFESITGGNRNVIKAYVTQNNAPGQLPKWAGGQALALQPNFLGANVANGPLLSVNPTMTNGFTSTVGINDATETALTFAAQLTRYV